MAKRKRVASKSCRTEEPKMKERERKVEVRVCGKWGGQEFVA